MNVYDSERIADVLAPLGYAVSETAEDADMVVLNTCHIREKATEKVYSELGRFKALKARTPGGGRGDAASWSPAASPRPRARRSCAASRRWTWWSGRRAITGCPS